MQTTVQLLEQKQLVLGVVLQVIVLILVVIFLMFVSMQLPYQQMILKLYITIQSVLIITKTYIV